MIPFAKTKAERRANGDPRPSPANATARTRLCRPRARRRGACGGAEVLVARRRAVAGRGAGQRGVALGSSHPHSHWVNPRPGFAAARSSSRGRRVAAGQIGQTTDLPRRSLMPLQTIEPRRLPPDRRAVARPDPRRRIPVGRPPPERDLARQLGVSRPSVREALIALEVEGLVEVRMGSGIYVRAQGGRIRASEPRRPVRAPARALRDRVGMRGAGGEVGEGGTVRGDRGALDEMEARHGRGVMPLRGDRLFHLRMAEATGNGALARVIKPVGRAQRPAVQQLEHHYDTPDCGATAMAEHRAVVARSPRATPPRRARRCSGI